MFQKLIRRPTQAELFQLDPVSLSAASIRDTFAAVPEYTAHLRRVTQDGSRMCWPRLRAIAPSARKTPRKVWLRAAWFGSGNRHSSPELYRLFRCCAGKSSDWMNVGIFGF